MSDEPTTTVLLLVDSECPVKSPKASPWNHVTQREGDAWTRPAGVTDEQLHFMVETMETWLVADPDALATYYGNGFKRDKLPARQDLEKASKADIAKALAAATAGAKTKGKYTKAHGFDLVGKLDSKKVRAAGFFAERFFKKLESL